MRLYDVGSNEPVFFLPDHHYCAISLSSFNFINSSVTMSEKPPRKTKSSGGGGKKLSAFNKFMQQEMTRLKEAEPNMPHQERFKQAATNWKNAKEKSAST